MLLSMTGFGRGESVVDDVKVATEVLGLNHRFLDISIRLPGALAALEAGLRRILKERLTRGRVTVTVDVASGAASSTLPATIDVELARRYADQLRELADELRLDDDVSVTSLLSLPGVVNTGVETVEADRLAPAAVKSLERALKAFDEARAAEGAALREDLEQRIDRISELAEAIDRRVPEVVEAYRQRLGERVRELGDLGPADPDRVALEVALFADKCDVSEEVVRLRSHIDQFREVLDSDKSAGRQLDFLCQEMHREITTIGAKGRDADVSHLVVEAKSDLEKVREQVQNIE